MTEPRYRTCCAKAEVALPLLPAESIDSLCCDPPSGIFFMGQEWDSDKGGRNQWVAWLTGVMKEAYRVMKPGAYGLVWSLPRQSHWTAWALEESGFLVKDVIQHLFCSGFPKSHNIGKAIDAMLGAERPILAANKHGDRYPNGPGGVGFHGGIGEYSQVGRGPEPLTGPATPEAAQWEGFGTQLKPSCEFWILVQKPISEKTIAANILKHGIGALNIDACRIGRAADDVPGWHQSGAKGQDGFLGEKSAFKIRNRDAEDIQSRCGGKGRWPSHLILSHTDQCVLVGLRRVKGCPATVVQGGKDGGGYDPGSGDGTRRGVFEGYGDADGMEEVEEWACVPSCAVRLLDTQAGTRKSGKMKAGTKRKNRDGFTGSMPEQTGSETYGDEGEASRFFKIFGSEQEQRGRRPGGFVSTGADGGDPRPNGPTYNDEGSASRFFYQPKPSKSEREDGLFGVIGCHKCGGLETKTHVDPESGREVKCLRNNHPTLKGIALMRYLIRLITPPGGAVLDTFMGSGTTGVAALLEGFSFLGIEMEERSHDIARARLAWASREEG